MDAPAAGRLQQPAAGGSVCAGLAQGASVQTCRAALRTVLMSPPLLPCLLQGGAGVQGMGVSMVDALSTLKVMGLHKEFAE